MLLLPGAGNLQPLMHQTGLSVPQLSVSVRASPLLHCQMVHKEPLTSFSGNAELKYNSGVRFFFEDLKLSICLIVEYSEQQ